MQPAGIARRLAPGALGDIVKMISFGGCIWPVPLRDFSNTAGPFQSSQAVGGGPP